MRIPSDPPDVNEILKNKKNIIELGKYLEREDIRKFTHDINEKYLYWDEFRHRPMPENTDKELLWAFIKYIRDIDRRELTLEAGSEHTFSLNLTDNILRQLNLFDLNLGGILSGSSIIPEEDKERYLMSSIMEEAIASSQLEGAATTRKIAKEMLRKSQKPRNKHDRMIMNNYVTIKKILELIDDRLTPDVIKQIHALMTKDTLDDREFEGRFRDNNEIFVIDRTTGESYYAPPDFREIPKFIEEICCLANDEDDTFFIHPIIKGILLHFLIGYLHPFVDGNGRTARAVFYWYVLSHGYWLFEYMSISRTILKSPVQYARAYLYTEKDDNDLTYFIQYNLKTIDQALSDLKTYIQKKSKEREKQDFLNILKLKGINNRQVYVIKKFSDNPKMTMTVREQKNVFNVVYETARTDLMKLVDMGFLDKKTVGNKLIFYRSKDFDDLTQI